MNWFILLIICISLDSFVIMMEKGATSLKIVLKDAFLHSLIFAFIDATLLLIGNCFGQLFYLDRIIRLNQFITFAILILISAEIFSKTYHKKAFVEKLNLHYTYMDSIKKAVISGIDCFLIGLFVSSFHLSFGFQWCTAFFVTFIMVFSAHYIGYHKGAAYQKFIGFLCSAIYLTLALLEMMVINGLV